MRAYRHRVCIIIGIAVTTPLFIAPEYAAAGVVLDGTLGRSGALTGPNYAITADLGKQHGGNLFHSFSQFNLVKNDIASFSGPASVTNIISRVTGGSASSIDGTIRSTISGANMYFINPNGIMFGPNATLDVSGSFHATTADYLKLGTDGRFDASIPDQSLLTSAPPSAFGFASATPAPITVSDSFLGVSEGNTISLIGGDIALTNAVNNNTILYAPGGRMNLGSVGSAGELVLSSTGIDTSQFSKMGTISISRTAPKRYSYDLYAGSETGGGGSIYIAGEKLVVDNAWIVSDSWGNDVVNKNIVINSRESIEMNNSAIIATETYSNSNGGSIYITSPSIALNSSSMNANTYSSGNAGDIKISANEFVLLSNDGAILSDALVNASGSSGNIEIVAPTITLDSGVISSACRGINLHGAGGSISLNVADSIKLLNTGTISTSTHGARDAGSISINTKSVEVQNEGWISSLSAGSGNAGTVSVHATETVQVSSSGSIGSETYGSGDGGSVSIVSNALTINDGIISSSNWGSGTGGSVLITSKDLTINHGGMISSSSVAEFPSSDITGDAGSISIETSGAATISGTITAFTSSTGNAGNISINADNLMLERAVISSGASGVSTGNAGSISVKSKNLLRMSASKIDATSLGPGNAGGITVEADTLNIKEGSVISTAADVVSGKSGSIHLTVAGVTTISDSTVSSNTSGFGNAGTIAINTDLLRVLDTGQITSAAFGVGNGGNISITANGVVTVSGYKQTDSGNMGSVISTETYGTGKAGNIDIIARNIELFDTGRISASAREGSSGEAGSINVKTEDSVAISGGHFPDGVSFRSEITSETFGIGKAGNINIETKNMELSSLGSISSTAREGSSGNGGDIGIIASGTVTVKEHKENDPSYTSIVSSATYGSGNAGNITIFSGILEVLDAGAVVSLVAPGSGGNGGNITITSTDAVTVAGYAPSDPRAASQISSRTYGPGKAGSISIETKNLTVIDAAHISTSAHLDSTGDGGDLTTKVESLILRNNGRISSASTGSGKAGEISIIAGSLIKMDNSSITTETINADGGSIFIDPPVVDLYNSRITTSVSGGTGNGGNIDMAAKVLVLDQSSIIANAEGGNGGNINLSTDSLIKSASGSIISASSKLGLQGNVFISSPVIDIGASLADMPDNLIDISSLAPKRCASRDEEISSFTVQETAGTAPNPDRPIVMQ